MTDDRTPITIKPLTLDDDINDSLRRMLAFGWVWNGVLHLLRGFTLEEVQSGGWSFSGQIVDADGNVLQEAYFTCPRCGMTSHNPKDVEQGYCGNCHDWTGGE